MNRESCIAGYFAVATVAVLVVKTARPLNLLLQYGKVAESQKNGPLVVQWAAGLTVPKSWFTHFYVVFAVLMWAQVGFIGDVFTKYRLIWMLLTTQATRRMVESFQLTNWGSESRMNISHYAVGLAFYLGISASCYLGLSDDALELKTVSRWNAVLIVVFALASVDQFQNHRHLALLVKYSLPTFRCFKVVACAHYLDEIVLYLVVLAVSMQQARLNADYSILASYVFVVVNLGVSAGETKLYYEAKFEDFNVEYAMVPYIY